MIALFRRIAAATRRLDARLDAREKALRATAAGQTLAHLSAEQRAQQRSEAVWAHVNALRADIARIRHAAEHEKDMING